MTLCDWARGSILGKGGCFRDQWPQSGLAAQSEPPQPYHLLTPGAQHAPSGSPDGLSTCYRPHPVPALPAPPACHTGRPRLATFSPSVPSPTTNSQYSAFSVPSPTSPRQCVCRHPTPGSPHSSPGPQACADWPRARGPAPRTVPGARSITSMRPGER